MYNHSLGQEFGFQKHNEIDVNFIWGMDQDFFPGCLGGGGDEAYFPYSPTLSSYVHVSSE